MTTPGKRIGTIVSLLFLLLISNAASQPTWAQRPPRLDLGGAITAGGDEEAYLRVLQIAGLAPLTPWSIQPFSPTQAHALRTLRAHPWAARFGGLDSNEISSRAEARLLRPAVRALMNSAFPFQDGGGPTWAGRGLTGEIQAGVAANWNALSIQLAPLAFAAQNAGFTLAPNGQSGTKQFADARYPNNIDAPQRFGNATYARLTSGTSTLALDAFDVFVGVSSAPQRWGPARDYPLVLGPNAGGFPMVFLGTSGPVDLWLFKVHARVIYGELGQSAFTDTVAGESRRLGSGVVATLLPRGTSGLEIGASRFIHRPWEGVPSLHTLLRPFGSGISDNLPGSTTNLALENQTASVFARWALPNAKAEFYGEMYREDFAGGFHVAASSLVEKPDDYSAFTLGFQHVSTTSGTHIRVIRGELVNGETSHQERGQRGFTVPLPIYIHSAETQGHTLDGLILGSPEAYGGAGWRLGLDDFTPGGSRSITLERSLRFDWLPTLPANGPMVHPDVIYDARLALKRFDGSREYGFSLIPAVDLNRNLVSGHDVFNLLAEISVRGW